MTTALIHAVGITRNYRRGADTVEGLPPIDIDLRAGELVAAFGPSLCGKTTLVNLLAGWDRPDTGTISWGASTAPLPWSQVAVVPQNLGVIDELDVWENITLSFRAHHTHVAPAATSDVSGVHALVASLGLDHLRRRNVDEISVGERQRLVVAHTLAGRPGVVLADEPVAHQDERNASIILALLASYVADGGACVIATREPSIAALASRRIEFRARR